MCGIFGCILKNGEAAPIIHAALKRLEYRGYDSVGEATINDGKLLAKKDAGKIHEVHALRNLDDLPGQVGIGHTRWATHGAPLQVNAHPHFDCSDPPTIAVVHNGIIENFIELKSELIDHGHVFKSKTDTEVIAHLIEENLYAKEHSSDLSISLTLEDAVTRAANRLQGSYAIAVISTAEPSKIVCARNESPLVLGIAEDAY
jgi:glucosamine--fructose-6-phosphate aminotransferase (isomerizing)